MKFLLSYKLFEKTSLINLGVPYSVMQQLQRNYTISDDAQWKLLKNKREITSSLKSKNALIISVCKTKIFIIFSHNSTYYVETYKETIKDDFGNEQWQRENRISGTLTEVINTIEKGCISYELTSGDWTHEFANIRKIKKEDTNFEDITNNFKKDFADSFTKIVKRLYGRKANVVTDIIINHLKNVKNNLSDEKIREILFLNADMAREVDVLKKKQRAKDPYKLYNDIVKADSLTIFNEYLIKFEEDYSDKYKEYLNVPIMIERYSREKVMTAFMIYLYCNKIIDL